MPKQLALDFNRDRIRAVEIDGSARNPRIRAFGSVEVPTAEVGEDPDALEAAALSDLLRSQRFAKDPAAAAMGSRDCTFRELDLPFTTDEQIRKVIKYEAESHLHLVDIDDVVVDFLKLRESRDGSHLLVMAYEKAVMESRLGQMDRNGVDPLFADLHLTSIHRALDAAGYFSSATEDDEEEGEATAAANDVVLVLECDTDVSHLLVVNGGQLLGARAIPVGVAERKPAAAPDEGMAPEAEPDEEAEPQSEDAEFVLVDEGEGITDAGQFFRRLRREVQRSLFPLGLAEESPRLLLLGPRVRDEEFVQRVGEELGMFAEVARPFDEFDHDLDPEVLENANAEGVAALGVALRLLDGAAGVDFRQEEVRYAKRFDQLKVAMSCAIIMGLIAAFLYTLVDVKKYLVMKDSTQLNAANAASNFLGKAIIVDNDGEEQNRDELERLQRNYKNGNLDHYDFVSRTKRLLESKHGWLGSRLGRSGGIPEVPSGLNVWRDLVEAIDKRREDIGRIEINRFDVKIMETPVVDIAGWVDEQGLTDQFRLALLASPIVENVTLPNNDPDDDSGRIKFSLKVTLKPEYSVNRRGGRR